MTTAPQLVVAFVLAHVWLKAGLLGAWAAFLVDLHAICGLTGWRQLRTFDLSKASWRWAIGFVGSALGASTVHAILS